MIALMAATIPLLSSCTHSNEQNANVQQMASPKVDETSIPGTRQMDPSAPITTEEQLVSLIESVKTKKVEKNVTLVGILKLGSNPKWDGHRLFIGNTSLHFVYDLDKEKYDGQTVLVLGDVRYYHGDESQLGGQGVWNVQHVEIIEQP